MTTQKQVNNKAKKIKNLSEVCRSDEGERKGQTINNQGQGTYYG
jgi:hypothetical protein